MRDKRIGWTIDDIQYWADKIEEKAREWGLNFRETIYQITSHEGMVGCKAYRGLPAHYPHWSFGQTFYVIQKLYRLALTGLPYELVINSDPCLVYLMSDNTLDLQILTMGHAGIGHNAVFTNNYYFQFTNPKEILIQMKSRADRVRSYVEDPSIGLEAVEEYLDALHSIAWQKWRHLGVKKLNHEEQCEKILGEARAKYNKERKRNPDAKFVLPDLNKKFPLEPEEDILLFIRDSHPYLQDWQKDLITIVDDLAGYFIPQIETKILNEGFASYIHTLLLRQVDLPDEFRIGIMAANARVVTRPIKSYINPYYLGFELLKHIHLKYGGYKDEDEWRREFHPKNNDEGWQRILRLARSGRDSSFLMEYLDEETMRKFDIFQHSQANIEKFNIRVIDKVSDEKNWREVKNTLIKSVGMGVFPVIKIFDSKYIFRGKQYFYLTHEFDSRELDKEYAEGTLKYLHFLLKGWKNDVMIKTEMLGSPYFIFYDGNKVILEKIK